MTHGQTCISRSAANAMASARTNTYIADHTLPSAACEIQTVFQVSARQCLSCRLVPRQRVQNCQNVFAMKLHSQPFRTSLQNIEHEHQKGLIPSGGTCGALGSDPLKRSSRSSMQSLSSLQVCWTDIQLLDRACLHNASAICMLVEVHVDLYIYNGL